MNPIGTHLPVTAKTTMPRYDFTSQRLFVSTKLIAAAEFDLDRGQANYLINVLRLKDQAPLLVFNGEDGEWQVELRLHGRKKASLRVVSQTREQPAPPDLEYLFAPLKQARMEYMVQKAVEMGAGTLQPVITQYTQVRKLNLDRMNAHIVEAAEQCGILSLPKLNPPLSLTDMLAGFAPDRHLIFCDEGEESQNPIPSLSRLQPGNYSVLIGPEGGFSPDERNQLRSRDYVTAIPLGPRVLRADTAAVASLAIVQAVLGDWRH